MADVVFVSVYSDIHCYNIRRLSAFLKNKGFTTRIVFMPQPFSKPYSENAICQLINLSRGSSLICLSFMSNYWDNTVQLIKAIKKRLDVPIIGGGVHPTVKPEECLDVIDMICVGEGEDTLAMLIDKIKKGETDYSSIPNLYYKISGKIFKNTLQIFHRVDEIPIPDFGIEEHYVLFGDKIQKMTYKLFRCFYGETYAIQCTFGCPYSCSYCCNNSYNKLFGFNLRKRNMGQVMGELRYIKNKFPFISGIRIDDDNFFCYTKEELEYFRDSYKEYIKLPLHIRGGNPLTIKKELIKICVDAGMDRIGVGIQTGSEKTKKLFKREIPNESILKACRTINSFRGLEPTYDIILDTPWEKEEDLIETLKLVLEIPFPYNLGLFSMTLFPGTELFEKALSDGVIGDIKKDVYRKHYYSLGDSYLNLLFPLFSSRYVPKRLKKYLIGKGFMNSRYKKYAGLILKGYRHYDKMKSLLGFLSNYLIKFDKDRTVFSIKKYYYDNKT